jgi:uncharacterized membrane protein YkvA (DUF1232 family)
VNASALGDEDKARLKAVYERSREKTLPHDVAYLAKMGVERFEKLVASDDPMAQQLGTHATRMQRLLADRVAGNRECPEDAVRACTAALLYLVNPFDLIADTTPGTGLLDDLYVVELALADCGNALDSY